MTEREGRKKEKKIKIRGEEKGERQGKREKKIFFFSYLSLRSVRTHQEQEKTKERQVMNRAGLPIIIRTLSFFLFLSFLFPLLRS